MKKTYLVSANIQIEVFADSEKEALSKAQDGDICYLKPTSVYCYDDEE